MRVPWRMAETPFQLLGAMAALAMRGIVTTHCRSMAEEASPIPNLQPTGNEVVRCVQVPFRAAVFRGIVGSDILTSQRILARCDHPEMCGVTAGMTAPIGHQEVVELHPFGDGANLSLISEAINELFLSVCTGNPDAAIAPDVVADPDVTATTILHPTRRVPPAGPRYENARHASNLEHTSRAV